MKKVLSMALALIMTFGAFAQINTHRLESAKKESTIERNLKAPKFDASSAKKHVVSQSKAMSVEITVGTINPLSVEATFTPNNEVVEYYYLAADASEGSMFSQYVALYQMFGMTLEDVVVGMSDNYDNPATGTQTVTLAGDFITPGVENTIYVAAVNANDEVSVFTTTYTATQLGGEGDAMVTLNIPQDSITAFSFYLEATPNDQTSYYNLVLLSQDQYTEMGWTADSVSDYFATNANPFYATFATPVTDLEPGTTYLVYAEAFNINGVSSGLISQTVTTTILGGSGTALVAVQISDVAETSASITFTPNDQTAYYYYLILSESDFDNAGFTSDADVKAYLEQENDRQYSQLGGTLNGLTPGTTYKVYAIAYNADGVADSIAPTLFTTIANGGTGLAEVAVTVEMVDGTAVISAVPNDQVSYYYFAIYYGIDNMGDDDVLDYLLQNGDTYTEDIDAEITEDDFDESELWGVYAIPFNANNEEGPRVAIRFTPEGVLSLADVELSSVSLYPNPASSELTVSSTSSINRIEIANLLGQKVYENATLGSNQATINVSTLQHGAYFVRVFTSEGTMTRKLIVR
ncbi:MAG: T9SS type A sorting domain-containing protein [Candidatus Onthomorpha sp.]